MKFAICNLGCKVNNYEANWYCEQLREKYEEVDFKDFADVYIINSCTVTNMAGSKTRQMLHKARKQNPKACIAVVSCYVQMEYKEEGIFDDADILIGSRHKTDLPKCIDDFLSNKEKISLVDDFTICNFEQMMLHSYNQTRAYLKIQDGCNQFCGYCTIPYARGRERSLNSDKVIEQAKSLVKSGHIEIVLTGIHTGRYNDGDCNLVKLIKRMLNEIEGLQRIRLSSIEMTEIDDELIDLMCHDKRVARHLHIPLQVGCDRLLALNNRPYTTQQYYERIMEIRSLINDISISSDVIVGLPTESEEEFKQTMAFIEKCQLSFIHVFPYARKKGTKDYNLKQVDAGAIRQRVNDLTALSNKMYNDYALRFIGKDVDVIYESAEDGKLRGHCSQYLVVESMGERNLCGTLQTVRIESKGDKKLYTQKI